TEQLLLLREPKIHADSNCSISRIVLERISRYDVGRRIGGRSMTRIRTLLIVALVAAMAAPAHADVTGFIGANTTPANRLVKGAAVGFSLLIIGFEFEYADTTEDLATRAPALKTGMVNVLLQPPV